MHAILTDIELRIKALAGLRVSFREMVPHMYPNKRFKRWVHWDTPLEVRKNRYTVLQFEWEKN